MSICVAEVLGGWGRQSCFLPGALVPSSLCMHQEQVSGHQIWLKPPLMVLPACGGRGGTAPAQASRAHRLFPEPHGAVPPSPRPGWQRTAQPCSAAGAGGGCSSTAWARTRCSGTRDSASGSRQFTFPLDGRLSHPLDWCWAASSPLRACSHLQGEAGRDLHSQPPRKS